MIRRKYSDFTCDSCGTRWFEQKNGKTSICSCGTKVYRADYYYFYCRYCCRTWRAYVTSSPSSTCSGCKTIVRAKIK